MIHVYMRVSSKRQDHRSQKPDLEKWLGTDDAKWYTDKFTGRTQDRPGWNKLYDALKKGDKVVVWRMDRLGRTCHELARLFKEFHERGNTLISVKDGIDLSTAAGRMMANILASIAEFDNEVRIERVLAGQAAAKAQGKSWGGRLKGARSAKIKALEKDIRALYRDGQSIKHIAETFGITRPTVYSVLELTKQPA